MLGPNGGHGSERSAESSSGKGGSSDSSDHFESGICVKCARSIRDVSVRRKTVDCAVIEAIKARDNIILKLGCGSEAFITKATPPYSHQNHSASSPSHPRLSPNQCRVPGDFNPCAKSLNNNKRLFTCCTYYQHRHSKLARHVVLYDPVSPSKP